MVKHKCRSQEVWILFLCCSKVSCAPFYQLHGPFAFLYPFLFLSTKWGIVITSYMLLLWDLIHVLLKEFQVSSEANRNRTSSQITYSLSCLLNVTSPKGNGICKCHPLNEKSVLLFLHLRAFSTSLLSLPTSCSIFRIPPHPLGHPDDHQLGCGVCFTWRCPFTYIATLFSLSLSRQTALQKE